MAGPKKSLHNDFHDRFGKAPMSSVQNPGWLFYIEDYTTQLYRDYNKPLQGSLLTNQYNGMSKGF